MDGFMTYTNFGNIGMTSPVDKANVRPNRALAKREDLDQYIEALSTVAIFAESRKEVSEAAKALTQPSKRQGTYTNAFKSGSLHGAALGRDSATLPNNNQSQDDLQKEKAKLDEKLKSAESRIRKLEDLLHRQSQPRPPSSNGFTLSHAPSFERQVTSPITNFTSALSKARDVNSRRSSTSSRRVSQNLDSEEKGLAQRIVSLEAELTHQREIAKDLKREVKARSNAEAILEEQVKDATATKEDLLGNMETQQHEFDNERRLLKDENTGLNIRLEETEDELDRVLNNNEHDDKIHILQEEVEKLRGHNQELEQARHAELRAHNTQLTTLEKESFEKEHRISGLESRVSELSAHIRDQDDGETRRRRTLRSALSHLSSDLASDSKIPEDPDALARTLESIAKASSAQQQELQSMVDRLRSENASLESRLGSWDSDFKRVQGEMKANENRAKVLDEQLVAKTTESSSLQSELDAAREEKEILQSMFNSSEGEVDSLKQQLAESSSKHEDLQTRFASLQGFHGDLDDQLREKNEEITLLQQQDRTVTSHNSAQADRAEKVSKQLRLQVESLKKMLELVGLMITRQDDKMAIQRIPKLPPANASTTLLDPSMPMRRSTSGTMPSESDLEALIESNALHWATTSTADSASARYEEFMSSLADFDLDIFNEAVIKRVKDVEHIARKWQREAKSYRDKSHRAQSEAHERIALRSFKEGDLALFLPTRDQATKPWAAFNVGAPHYFLREQDSHKLGKRDWLIARISKVEERVVDLSKSLTTNGLKVPSDHHSNSISADDNPYELSDGLRWYLVDAAEEKLGAPINIGTGKATVAMAKEQEPVKVSMGHRVGGGKSSDRNDSASKTLARSLDSRRSSTNSRKSWIGNTGPTTSAPAGLEGMLLKRTDSNASRQTGESATRQTQLGDRASIIDTHEQQDKDKDKAEPSSRMQELHPSPDEVEIEKDNVSPTTITTDTTYTTTNTSTSTPTSAHDRYEAWMHSVWES